MGQGAGCPSDLRGVIDERVGWKWRRHSDSSGLLRSIGGRVFTFSVEILTPARLLGGL